MRMNVRNNYTVHQSSEYCAGGGESMSAGNGVQRHIP